MMDSSRGKDGRREDTVEIPEEPSIVALYAAFLNLDNARSPVIIMGLDQVQALLTMADKYDHRMLTVSVLSLLKVKTAANVFLRFRTVVTLEDLYRHGTLAKLAQALLKELVEERGDYFYEGGTFHTLFAQSEFITLPPLITYKLFKLAHAYGSRWEDPRIEHVFDSLTAESKLIKESLSTEFRSVVC